MKPHCIYDSKHMRNEKKTQYGLRCSKISGFMPLNTLTTIRIFCFKQAVFVSLILFYSLSNTKNEISWLILNNKRTLDLKNIAIVKTTSQVSILWPMVLESELHFNISTDNIQNHDWPFDQGWYSMGKNFWNAYVKNTTFVLD